jgi:hypothetical protein
MPQTAHTISEAAPEQSLKPHFPVFLTVFLSDPLGTVA